MIHTGDCIEVMAGMPADSVDAVCTDPPYNLEFMGKSWDKFGAVVEHPDDGEGPWGRTARVRYGKGAKTFQAWCEAWGREALRVTKPGGYLLAFGGTRTHHRLVCGLEDAGWIIRDELDWIYACLSDDTEILTDLGWVRYNRANDAKLAAAFDPTTSQLRWERIRKVHRYDHDGPMVEVGPSLVTLNHRVVLDTETSSVPRLPRLWDDLPTGVGLGEAREIPGLLTEVQRVASHTRSPLPSGQGVERRATATLVRGDEGRPQPRLEGRRYRVQEARELLWGSIRARTGLGEADGPQRRLRDGAPSPARRALRLLAHAFGVREPRKPRPDRQPPREREPLAGQPDPQAVRGGQGARGDGLPPGDTPRLVDYAGVVWCISVPSGAFVARRGGVAFVTGNSGFPKGKANLKPAHEPIVLARKPGPLRPLAIDECRIPGAEPYAYPNGPQGNTFTVGAGPDGTRQEPVESNPSGRWPSNLLLSDPELFDTANPYVVGSGAVTDSPATYQRNVTNWSDTSIPPLESMHGKDTAEGYGDTGGYSRFFIIPKADRADREPVLRGQLEAQDDDVDGSFGLDGARPHTSPDYQYQRKARENSHPTVKPVDLMRHLIRLVTPSGGTVLDCFLGSGTTAIAAEMEGFQWIGIEKEPEYVAIAEARLNGVQRGLGLDVPAPVEHRKKIGVDDPSERGRKYPRRPGTTIWGQGSGTLPEPLGPNPGLTREILGIPDKPEEAA